MMNPKVFLEKIFICVNEDKLTFLEAIIAIQEKYDLDEEDIIEILKLEKTLNNDLKAECIANRMLIDRTKSINIESFFK